MQGSPPQSMNSNLQPVISPPQPEALALAPRPELVRLIESFCGAKDPPQTFNRFIKLIRWIRDHEYDTHDFSQLNSCLSYLEDHAEVRARFQEKFRDLLKHLRFTSLLAESGVPSDRSLLSEVVRRVVGRVLPSARDDADASRLLVALFSSKRDAQHFLAMPSETFIRTVQVVTSEDAKEFWDQPRQDLRDALRLLAARALVA